MLRQFLACDWPWPFEVAYKLLMPWKMFTSFFIFFTLFILKLLAIWDKERDGIQGATKKTTQLNNDEQMPEFHCHCECSKCSPPAPSNNISLQSPYLRNLLQPCRSLPVAGCPDNLKHFLEFGACFQLCSKLAVSLQHCTPYMTGYHVTADDVTVMLWQTVIYFVYKLSLNCRSF